MEISDSLQFHETESFHNKALICSESNDLSSCVITESDSIINDEQLNSALKLILNDKLERDDSSENGNNDFVMEGSTIDVNLLENILKEMSRENLVGILERMHISKIQLDLEKRYLLGVLSDKEKFRNSTISSIKNLLKNKNQSITSINAAQDNKMRIFAKQNASLFFKNIFNDFKVKYGPKVDIAAYEIKRKYNDLCQNIMDKGAELISTDINVLCHSNSKTFHKIPTFERSVASGEFCFLIDDEKKSFYDMDFSIMENIYKNSNCEGPEENLVPLNSKDNSSRDIVVMKLYHKNIDQMHGSFHRTVEKDLHDFDPNFITDNSKIDCRVEEKQIGNPINFQSVTKIPSNKLLKNYYGKQRFYFVPSHMTKTLSDSKRSLSFEGLKRKSFQKDSQIDIHPTSHFDSGSRPLSIISNTSSRLHGLLSSIHPKNASETNLSFNPKSFKSYPCSLLGNNNKINGLIGEDKGSNCGSGDQMKNQPDVRLPLFKKSEGYRMEESADFTDGQIFDKGMISSEKLQDSKECCELTLPESDKISEEEDYVIIGVEIKIKNDGAYVGEIPIVQVYATGNCYDVSEVWVDKVWKYLQKNWVQYNTSKQFVSSACYLTRIKAIQCLSNFLTVTESKAETLPIFLTVNWEEVLHYYDQTVEYSPK